MSTATEIQQPTTSLMLRHLVARHPVTAFLIMAFTFAWGGMLPLLLSESGFGVLPFSLPWQPFTAVLSIFGLALPAFLVTTATDGRTGVQDLLHRLLRWRVGFHWYFIALFGLLATTLVASIPFLGIVPLEALVQKWTLLFTVFLPGVLVPFVLINLWEELAWTGYMQHTLQEGHGPVLASVMVAPLFALIHMPAFFVAGWISDKKMPLSQFSAVLLQVGIMAIFAIFLRVFIMWLYNGAGRSVLLVALFHSTFNMTNGQKITPELLLLPETLVSLIPAVAVMVIAALLALFTRGLLGYKAERVASQPTLASTRVRHQGGSV